MEEIDKVGVLRTGRLEYLGQGGWSTMDRGGGVPGTRGVEYLGAREESDGVPDEMD